MENCEYSRVSGVGIRSGLFHIGAGYFDHRLLMIDKNKNGTCRAPLAEVTIFSQAGQ